MSIIYISELEYITYVFSSFDFPVLILVCKEDVIRTIVYCSPKFLEVFEQKDLYRIPMYIR